MPFSLTSAGFDSAKLQDEIRGIIEALASEEGDVSVAEDLFVEHNTTTETLVVTGAALFPPLSLSADFIADSATRGLLTTTAQIISGAKTFQGDVTVSGALSATLPSSSITTNATRYFVTDGVQSITGNKTFHGDVTVSGVLSASLPSSSVTTDATRFFVSDGSQTYQGNKSFTSSVTFNAGVSCLAGLSVSGGTLNSIGVISGLSNIQTNASFLGVSIDVTQWCKYSTIRTRYINIAIPTYTVTGYDSSYLLVSGTSEIRLPALASVHDGIRYLIKKRGSGTVTITPVSSTLNDASTSILLNDNASAIGVTYINGVGWFSDHIPESIAQVVNGTIQNLVNVTASRIIQATDSILVCRTDLASGGVTIFFPNPASTPNGRTITVKRVGGYSVTISRDGHQMYIEQTSAYENQGDWAITADHQTLTWAYSTATDSIGWTRWVLIAKV